MLLSNNDLNLFFEQGFIFRPAAIARDELSSIIQRIDTLTLRAVPSRAMERDGKTARALHGCHSDDSIFDRLTRSPLLLESAKRILQSEVYLYQFKINLKAAFNGDVWPWHQDYIFWRNEDGMPKPQAVNAVVFIDEVTEFNGPIYFIPRSHSHGCLETAQSNVGKRNDGSDWRDNVSADLKYQIQNEDVTTLGQRYGLTAPKGPPGSILFFHCNIIHGSPPNISPFPRRIIIITYNSVDNIQHGAGSVRPEFLVGRDYRPLEPS